MTRIKLHFWWLIDRSLIRFKSNDIRALWVITFSEPREKVAVSPILHHQCPPMKNRPQKVVESIKDAARWECRSLVLSLTASLPSAGSLDTRTMLWLWRTITKEIEKAFVVYHFSSQLSSCSFVHSTASWCGSFLYFWWLQQSDSDFAHSVWCQNNQHDANRPLGQEKKETKVF